MSRRILLNNKELQLLSVAAFVKRIGGQPDRRRSFIEANLVMYFDRQLNTINSHFFRKFIQKTLYVAFASIIPLSSNLAVKSFARLL